MGWVTVAAYVAAAFLCGWCASRERRAGERQFWIFLTVVMALLGVNKQLDLQTWFTQVGRDMALAQGWYESRQTVQIAFIAALALSAVACLVWLRYATRGFSSGARWACVGLVLLAAFIVVRAASFHHIDRWLYVDVDNVRMNWILELGGIGSIAVAAFARL